MADLEFSENELEQSATTRLDRVVAAMPGAPALDDGNRVITFQELDFASSRVAALILERVGEDPSPVATLLDFGAESIVALIGILKAGKIFVGLESWFPVDRLQSIQNETGACLVLTTETHRALAEQLVGDPKKVLVFTGPFSTQPTDSINLSKHADENFGIFFTSGSTGKPKGVLTPNRIIVHRSRLDLGFTRPGDRQGFFRSLSFKASVSQIFNPLANGATICTYDMRKLGFGPLSDWIRDQKITGFRPSVSIMRNMMETTSRSDGYPAMRWIAVGGSRLYEADVSRLREHFKGSVLYHYYASSESGLIARTVIDETVQPENGFYPVGRIAEGKKVHLIGTDGQPVRPGETGEITVESRFMCREYWKDPEQSALKYTRVGESDTFIYKTGDLGRFRADGLLEHLGRVDHMVKVRGYRVETAEVEAALHNLPEVKEAAVKAVQDANQDNELIAYIIPASGHLPSHSDLRKNLSEGLPEYMVPTRFVFMDSFPMIRDSRVNYNELPAPGRARPDLAVPFAPATTQLENSLCAIWAAVLDLDRVGIHDHFLDLGGHSLLAMRIVGRVGEALSLEIPLRLLLDSPTVSLMASSIVSFQAELAGADEMEALLDEIESLTDEEIGKMLDH